MARSRATPSPATVAPAGRDYAAIALAYAKAAAADKKQRKHCKWVRLAAQRHLDDLKRQRSVAWGYRFDPWHANDICDFAEKLPHVEGVWETPTITLEPFQIFILAMVFGWRRRDTGGRRFTSVYEEVARKNAKSTKTAIVSLYCLACEDEPGPQVLTAATTFDQAKKVFHPAKRMVEKTPALQEAFALIPWAKSITCGDNGGYLQPMHSKAKSQDGHNPHLVTMDELHAHSDRGLFDVMNSAFGARRNPLMWIITTAGFNLHGVCYEQRTLATKVLERTVVAEHIFAIIFTLDRAEDYGDDRKLGDDPYDASKWIKANPLIEASRPLRDEVAKRAVEAQASPAAEGEFKTKHLNQWLGAASAWLNVTQWALCADASLTLDDFVGLDCYLGGDLSNVDDLSALVLAAEDSTGRLLVKPWFYVPAARLENQNTSLKQITDLYRGWVAEGALTATPGDFIDHNTIEAQIRELKSRLAIRRATFDQWNSALAMASRLNQDFGDGGEAFAVQLAKNANNITDPAKELEARVKSGPARLRHDANPVLTWMVGNAVVERRVNGSILPKKETPNSPQKIDGVDAVLNATAPMIVPVADDNLDDVIAGLKAHVKAGF
ncbi:terminase large subunit [Sphingomonas sp. BK235]|uniref:terminase large subunit n=1 Tax=Sphingomonas sp. BK235 TaxID=2512131 RepID=UPI0010520AD7|nr:terminase large subunit [Sphingomonas sp. BK235]TCP36539.1 phage terminase large subunit-like protein [Sphingomonas sp. BK235]